MTNRPSPMQRRSASVTPFTVKRKEINYGSLTRNRQPLQQQFSLNDLLYKREDNESGLCRSGYEQILMERNAKLQELEKQLKEAKKDQQSWRHKCLLLEREREEFAKSIQTQCEKDKELLKMELQVLKETLQDKVQSMASSIAKYQDTVAVLRQLLQEHNIEEYKSTQERVGSQLLGTSYEQDAEYIRQAYAEAQHIRQDKTLTHLWNRVQATSMALQQELNMIPDMQSLAHFSAEELTRMMREDDRSSTPHGVSAIKALFGRKSSTKRKS